MIYLLPIVAVAAIALAVPLHPADRRNTKRRRPQSSAQPIHVMPAPPAPPVATAGPIIKQLVWAAAAQPAGNAGTPRYPTLEAIDRARGESRRPFASAANAAALEQEARKLVDHYWSELVWLTGLIDGARFDALCAALEKSRPMPGQDVELVVVRELKVHAQDVAS